MSTQDTTLTQTDLPLDGGRWELDRAHSSVTFAIRHLGLSKVRGRFNDFDAVLVVGESLEDTYVEARIDVRSLDTANSDRDGHVKSPDFLDAETHPEMRFRSTRISGTGEQWQMEGDATVIGQTRPFVFDVEFNGVNEFMGNRHAGFGSSGQIRRKEFGLEFPGIANMGPVLGDVVSFELDLQFVEPATEG